MADPNSRYASVGQQILVAPDGTRAPYLRRRFLPDPEAVRPAGYVTVRSGERIDLVALRALGSPLQFHVLCDANRIADPLVVADRGDARLVVPMPTLPGREGGT